MIHHDDKGEVCMGTNIFMSKTRISKYSGLFANQISCLAHHAYLEFAEDLILEGLNILPLNTGEVLEKKGS